MTEGTRPAIVAVLGLVTITVWTGRFLAPTGPVHDEGITLLAATGQEARYEALREKGAPPFGVVVPAATWQQFTFQTRPVRFSAIRDDVSRYDRHPPLGFWLYNLWLAAFGTATYRIAVLLSAVLIWGSALLLYATARILGRSPSGSTVIALLYLSANATVTVGLYVRQYALLTLLVAATVTGGIVLVRFPDRRWAGALLAAAALAGMLTQYLYAVHTIAFHAAILMILARRREWRTAALLATGYAVAAGAFLSLMGTALPWAGTSEALRPLAGRVSEAFTGLSGLLLPIPASLPRPILILGGALTLVLTLGAVWIAALRTARAERWSLAAAFVSAMLLQVALVIVGVVPAWATAPPYVCPLLAFAVLAVADAVPSGLAPRVLLTIAAVVAVAQGGYIARRIMTRYLQPPRRVADCGPTLVLITTVFRGDVLPLTMQLPPDLPVLVGGASSVERALSESPGAHSRLLWFRENDPSGAVAMSDLLAAHGYAVRALRTTHPGVHDVLLAVRAPAAAMTEPLCGAEGH